MCGSWPVDHLPFPNPLSLQQLLLSAYAQMHRHLTEESVNDAWIADRVIKFYILINCARDGGGGNNTSSLMRKILLHDLQGSPSSRNGKCMYPFNEIMCAFIYKSQQLNFADYLNVPTHRQDSPGSHIN